jgi:hypothetical protein
MSTTMSEHEWVQENIAAYNAGGLESTERDRLETHITQCDECRRALEDLRQLDGQIGSLFTTARPSAALEDRMIQSLRKKSSRRLWRPHWIVTTAAAVILLGCVGAFADYTLRKGFPDLNERERALNTLSELGVAAITKQQTLEDAGQLAKEVREEPERNPAELMNSVGYNPPARALIVKGSSRIHSNRARRSGKSEDDDASAAAGEKGDSVGELGLTAPLVKSPQSLAAITQTGENLARAGRGGKGKDSEETLQKLEESTTGSLLFGASPARKPAAESIPAQASSSKPAKRPATPAEKSKAAAAQPNVRPYLSLVDRSSSAGMKSEAEIAVRTSEGNLLTPLPNAFNRQVPSANKGQASPKPPIVEQTAPLRKVIRSGEIEFEIQSFDSAFAAVTKLVNEIKGGFVATVNSEKLPNGKVRGSVVVRVPPESLDTLILDLRKELGKIGELKGMKIGSQDITKQYTDLDSHLRAARTMEERLLQIIKEGKGAIKDLVQAEKELGVWRTKIEELEGEIRYYSNQIALSTLTINLYEKEISSPFSVVETQRVLMGLEVDDVEKTYQQVLSAVAEAKGRITKSELKQQSPQQFGAVINFEVAPESAGPVRDRLKQLGNVARLEVDRLQQAEGGTGRPQAVKTKQNDTQFFVSLYNLANFTPRQSATIQVATQDVALALRSLQEAVATVKGRIINSQFNEQDKQNITAQLDFDLRRAEEPVVNAALGKIGDVFSRIIARNPDAENVLDTKVRFLVSLISQSRIPPRESVVLGIEVTNVDATASSLSAQVSQSKGRTVESHVAHERNGRVTAKLVYDVPLSAAAGLVENFRTTGIVRVQKSSRNEQVPESSLAIARLDVTLSNTELIVPSDEGIWPQVRRGLSTSVTALSWSLTVVIIGVCFVLPWVIVLYAAYRIVLRLRRGRVNSAA